MSCKFIRKGDTKICAGDLRDRIVLKTRSITPPSGNSVDFTETFVTIATVWALVQPLQGYAKFGTVVLADPLVSHAISHSIYIRYRLDLAGADLTQETWVEYKGQNYDIVEIMNVDEMDHYLLLSCKVRGKTSSEGSRT